MTFIKTYWGVTGNFGVAIRTKTYCKTLAHVQEMLKELEIDFQQKIDPEDINIVVYGGDRIKGIMGLEFEMKRKPPKNYKKIDVPECLLNWEEGIEEEEKWIVPLEIGYSHPDNKVSKAWMQVYFTMVKHIHLEPESIHKFNNRLKDDPEQVIREDLHDEECYQTNNYGNNTGTVNEGGIKNG